jgi:uncharacterized protein YbcC (UPF0753/DUF2309 family)
MKIEEYVRKLPPELRGKNRSLIEECIERERKIIRSDAVLQNLISGDDKETVILYQRMKELYSRLINNNEPSREPYEKAQKAFRIDIQSSEVYRA